jgi:hypothetical protein
MVVNVILVVFIIVVVVIRRLGRLAGFHCCLYVLVQ